MGTTAKLTHKLSIDMVNILTKDKSDGGISVHEYLYFNRAKLCYGDDPDSDMFLSCDRPSH